LTTSRLIYDQVRNALDYLLAADLVYYANSLSISDSGVSWHASDRSIPFLLSYDHPTIDQYFAWLGSGAFTAILFDASLLQVTYWIENGQVSGHRLAYVPCPYLVDFDLLSQGEPVADVVELYRSTDAQLRSPIRFDYDPSSAKAGHPAAHLTINSAECRIACVAPLHVLRFLDFVFRHFYADLWMAHESFFSEGRRRHIGPGSITNDERQGPHLAWELNPEPVPPRVGARRALR
jgi:hypothetical protein